MLSQDIMECKKNMQKQKEEIASLKQKNSEMAERVERLEERLEDV